MVRRFLAAFILLLMATNAYALAQRNVAADRRSNDLADSVQGTYVGDVIADARGSSRSGVTVRVIRIGPSLVEIRSDYDRVPVVRIPLEEVMGSVLAASGEHVFLIDRNRDPRRLQLTIDDASLSLVRR